MKLSLLQQNGNARRSNSFRAPSSVVDSGVGAVDGVFRSPAAIFWLALHAVCCVISLVLGFRFSRLLFFLLFTYPSSPSATIPTSTSTTLLSIPLPRPTQDDPVFLNRTASRVVVGRHGIHIRPWPHPDPVEVMRAHQLIERVQREQRLQFGVKSPKLLIVVTPTYVRTFQTLHLSSLAHTLMLLPYQITWVVVEAGGTSNETAAIVDRSGLSVIHLPFDGSMPVSWAGRRKMEAEMRVLGLR